MCLSLQKAYPAEALGACQKSQALEKPVLPLTKHQPWLSEGERALALGKHQVRMRVNTAEMCGVYAIGLLIRAGFLEEDILKQEEARDSVGQEGVLQG